jgi:hypothetical protein
MVSFMVLPPRKMYPSQTLLSISAQYSTDQQSSHGGGSGIRPDHILNEIKGKHDQRGIY